MSNKPDGLDEFLRGLESLESRAVDGVTEYLVPVSGRADPSKGWALLDYGNHGLIVHDGDHPNAVPIISLDQLR